MIRLGYFGFHNPKLTAVGFAALAALILFLPAHAIPMPPHSQSQTVSPPKFEYDIVSIKPFDPQEGAASIGTGYSPDSLTAKGVRLWWMFRMAYDMPRPQIVGTPNWVDDFRFTIEARLDTDTAAAMQKLSPDELRSARQQMLRSIMADRFGLKFHLETRELPAYFLTIAKGGPKLQDAKPDFVGKSDISDINGNRATDFVTIAFGQQSTLVGQAASMTTLSGFLSQWALSLSGENARPVIDKTGLTGRYDFAVKFTPENVFVAPPSADAAGGQPQIAVATPTGPNLFKALQDNLGLRLESGKGPVPVIVIDHVEKPSGN